MRTITSTNRLAIDGGTKVIPHEFPRYNPIGEEEVAAATAVVKSGLMSQFLGEWSSDFYGGPKVQEFESNWREYFGVRHAVSVNSLTSGLETAVGAIGIEPGDEVIVPPLTMVATATAILHWNGIPVFADIEEETFNLDPASVEANITPYTKAIFAVDMFGHSADMDGIMAVARKHGLKVLSDTAQSPGAMYGNRYAGTIADIGGYSLNYHKTIHTGEGGMLVTNDDELAERMQLIRNHAEAVVGPKNVKNLSNMIGHNFRLGEVECAIGIEQLKKLRRLAGQRQRAGERLSAGLTELRGLRVPVVKPGCTHTYHVYPILIDPDVVGVNRESIHRALVAEGVPSLSTTFSMLHMLPLFQQKIAYGSSGFPWTSDICKRNVSYARGICPVAEDLYDRRYMNVGWCLYNCTDEEVDLIIEAFHKVWSHLSDLEHRAD